MIVSPTHSHLLNGAAVLFQLCTQSDVVSVSVFIAAEGESGMTDRPN